MKRFVWRLQRVLDIKIKQEQKKRVELLELTERLAQTRGELLMQKRILENVIDGLTGKGPQEQPLVAGAGRLGEQEFFLKCSAASDELIKKLGSKVGKLESQQKEKIAEVLKAKRFKKGMEKLKAEMKRQFIKEQEKLEQKEMDEGAVIGFARKKIDPIGKY